MQGGVYRRFVGSGTLKQDSESLARMQAGVHGKFDDAGTPRTSFEQCERGI